MSPGEPAPYRIEDGAGVKEQVQTIKSLAAATGKLEQFEIMEKARHRLRTDPNGWGDPIFRAKTVDAVMRSALLRPLSFRYAVYEQAHAVVLVRVLVYADFA